MFKQKLKSGNFWISLTSAVLLVIRIIAEKFNIFIEPDLYMDVVTGICSIFVIFGIISTPSTKAIQSATEMLSAKTCDKNKESIFEKKLIDENAEVFEAQNLPKNNIDESSNNSLQIVKNETTDEKFLEEETQSANDCEEAPKDGNNEGIIMQDEINSSSNLSSEEIYFKILNLLKNLK